jgi:hypothetical protein
MWWSSLLRWQGVQSIPFRWIECRSSKRRLGLRAKSSWVEALIKGDYVVRQGAVSACQRGGMRSACAKRVEAKESHCERNGEA